MDVLGASPSFEPAFEPDSNVRILELEFLEKGLRYCCSVRGLMRGCGGSAAGNGSLRKARLKSQKVHCVRIVMLRSSDFISIPKHSYNTPKRFTTEKIHETSVNMLKKQSYCFVFLIPKPRKRLMWKFDINRKID